MTFQLPFGDLSAPVRYADLARQLGVELGRAGAAGRRPRGRAGASGALGAWCSTPATTTPGAPGSFFTNPVLSTGAFARLAARAGLAGVGEPPSYPAEGGIKTSAAWLIERAGFGKGYGLPGPAALSTKHTLALTNRGGASAGRPAGAGPDHPGRRRRTGSACALEPEPRLVGLTL